MATLFLTPASEFEVPELAEMNAALIADEGSDTRLDDAGLRARFIRFFKEGYTALIIRRDDEVIGYVLDRSDTDDNGSSYIFLRHLYLKPPYRRRGMGREVYHLWEKERACNHTYVSINVWMHNMATVAFWQTLGFHTMTHGMRRHIRDEA